MRYGAVYFLQYRVDLNVLLFAQFSIHVDSLLPICVHRCWSSFLYHYFCLSKIYFTYDGVRLCVIFFCLSKIYFTYDGVRFCIIVSAYLKSISHMMEFFSVFSFYMLKCILPMMKFVSVFFLPI